MSDEFDHVLLAGALQKPSRISDLAQLRPSHFVDDDARTMFRYALKYWRKSGKRNSLDLALARTRFEGSKSGAAGRLLGLIGEYDRFEPVTDSEFRDAILKTDKRWRAEKFRERVVEAAEHALNEDDREAARAMREGLDLVDQELSEERSFASLRDPELLEEEIELVDARAEEMADEDAVSGFDTGFSAIAKAVSFRRKEMVVIGGYSSDGKTNLAANFAYSFNASGANVLYVSLEMTYREIRTLLAARHAAKLDSRGVRVRAVYDGKLDARERDLYKRALRDWKSGPQGAGHFDIWSPDDDVEFSDLSDKVLAVNEEVGLDVVVVDYLELVSPSKNLGQHRLNVSEMFAQTKKLARRAGVLMVVLHQISRKGREAAEKRHPPHYVMGDLGESSGVERHADTVVWVYCDTELEEQKEARVGIAKARKGGKIPDGFHVYADYPKGVVAELECD